jgi:hypothetical protein
MNLVWSGTEYTDPGTVLVLLTLADWSNDQGTSWPSIPQLAQKSRLSERQIQYILSQLQKDRIVQMEIGGGRKPNTYRLNLPVLEGIQPEILFPKEGCQEKPAVHSVHQCTPCTGAQRAPLPDSPPPPYKELPPTPSETRTTTLSGTSEISTGRPANLPKIITDARHDVIARAIRELQLQAGRPEVWDGSAAKKLAVLLKLRSKWTTRILLRCVANRFASVEINPVEHPRRWLSSLSDYAAGPLDQYGKLARKQWPLAEELFAIIWSRAKETFDVQNS